MNKRYIANISLKDGNEFQIPISYADLSPIRDQVTGIIILSNTGGFIPVDHIKLVVVTPNPNYDPSKDND